MIDIIYGYLIFACLRCLTYSSLVLFKMDAECLKTILLDIAVHPVVMGNLIGRCGRKNVIGHTLLHAWVLCVFVCRFT